MSGQTVDEPANSPREFGADPDVSLDQATIECCLDNVPTDALQAIRNTDAAVETRYCLQRCGTCYAEPFCVVAGSLVSVSDHEALVDRLESGDGHNE